MPFFGEQIQSAFVASALILTLLLAVSIVLFFFLGPRSRASLSRSTDGLSYQVHPERRHLVLLAETTRNLELSSDYQKTLEGLASKIVPHIADWCLVDLVGDSGAMEPLAVAREEQSKPEWEKKFRLRFPRRLDDGGPYAQVYLSGRSRLFSEFPADGSTEELAPKAMDSSGVYEFGSTMISPILIRDKILGMITLVRSASRLPYGPSDLAVCEDLAARASLVLDNAKLADQAREALAAREAALSKLQKQITHQAVLADLSQSALSRSDRESLVTDAVFWLTNTFKVRSCLLVDPLADGAGFSSRMFSGPSPSVPVVIDDFETVRLFHKILASDSPYFFEHSHQERGLAHLGLFLGYESGIFAQLKTSEKVWGLLGVFSETSQTFNQDDIHFLQSIANVVAAAFERIETEKALRSSERKYHQLFDHSPDGLVISDLDFRITMVNPEAVRIFGFESEGEMIGFDARALIGPPNLSDPAEQAAQAKRPGGIRDVEIVLKRRDGTEFPAEISGEALRDDAGHPVAFFGIIRDITQRKELEEMKDDLIAAVSHELRTPLTSIYVSLDLISSGKVSSAGDQAKALIDVANKNCKRLIHLINDFLDLQKIESSHMSFDLVEMSLEDLLLQAVEMNTTYAEQYGVKFVTAWNCREVQILIDPDRFIQVLTNLLSNAAKFSPQGSEVRIAAERVGANVRVSVINPGPRIGDEYRNKLFQKFVQVDASVRRKRDGTGLGLAISKGIVEKMGGRIDFLSDDSQTEFFLEFPVLVPHGQEREP